MTSSCFEPECNIQPPSSGCIMSHMLWFESIIKCSSILISKPRVIVSHKHLDIGLWIAPMLNVNIKSHETQSEQPSSLNCVDFLHWYYVHCLMTGWYGTNVHIARPFSGDPPVNDRVPSRRASNAELWFRCCQTEQAVENTCELPVIWESMTLSGRHYVVEFIWISI